MYEPMVRPGTRSAKVAPEPAKAKDDRKNGLRGLDYGRQVEKLTPAGKTTGDHSSDWKGPPVDLEDPALRETHRDGSVEYKRFEGDLFIDGVSPEDVQQGKIADCYLMAAMASVAKAHPDVIKNGIRRCGDGVYEVRLFEKQGWGDRANFKEVWVKVDTELPAMTGADKPAYGRGMATNERGRELWPSLLEKAYAEWHQGYDKVGEGGSSLDAIESFCGKSCTSVGLGYTPADKVWEKLKAAFVPGQIKAVTAGTHGKEQEELYKGTNLYAWHAYSVLGIREEGGKRLVTIRNPWGNTEPGHDGKDDGIFELSLEDFMKYYDDMNLER